MLLFDADGETFERELTCGPASVAVTARYRADAGATGDVVVSLSFGGS